MTAGWILLGWFAGMALYRRWWLAHPPIFNALPNDGDEEF